ncbi:hypothetical protein AAFF_G00357410 [Aldrovandia affinis]|uniref:ABC-2 type transporter transmembrane domain-containing protein n=1 Tax=Aldrovandia affinis TaxID=143900 RepID=A0AAD7T964_9TELE|nr:hypothetical protein AAFF_G00357410 [Aldrovandia affinis]
MLALLNNPVFATALNLQLRGTAWTAEQLANFLYNGPPGDRPPGMAAYDWRDAFNNTSEILGMLTQFIGCIDLDKFEAVPTEENLIEKSLRLLEEEKFWAGIVFQDIDPQASHPPPFVKYKIRMDIEEVERTNKAKESFIQSIGGILPMFLVLAFMYSVCLTIKGLVLEKELRLKEVLRAVGVGNSALWLSWFIENFVLLMVPCALISVMVKINKEIGA